MSNQERSGQATGMPDNLADHNGGRRPLVLVFMRAENDIDHVVPVIDALLQGQRVEVQAIVYDPLKTFNDDPRIAYLRQTYGFYCRHGFQAEGVGLQDRLLSRSLQWLLWRCLHILRRNHSRRIRALLKAVSTKLRKHLEHRLNLVAKSRILSIYLARYPAGLVVFDHTMNEFAVTLVKAAQLNGFRAAALPHAVVHRMDAPDNPGDDANPALAKQLPNERPPGSHGYNLYDAVVAPNDCVAERMIKRGVLAEKIAVMGSIRFSDHWTRQLRNMLPAFNTGSDGIRVLLVLSKRTPLVDWDAVDRVIAHLAETPGLDVLVKVHPRSEMSGLPTLNASSPIKLAPTKLNTASLIDWADLVVFWGSSAIYDALRVRKPIIQLGYVTSSHFDFEDLIPSWQVNSFDAFRQRLDRFITDRSPTYDEAEARITLEKLVDAGQSNTPARYAVFLEEMASERARHATGANQFGRFTTDTKGPAQAAQGRNG